MACRVTSHSGSSHTCSSRALKVREDMAALLQCASTYERRRDTLLELHFSNANAYIKALVKTHSNAHSENSPIHQQERVASESEVHKALQSLWAAFSSGFCGLSQLVKVESLHCVCDLSQSVVEKLPML